MREISNIEINNGFAHHKEYLGTYAKDAIPAKVWKQKGFIIINMDDSDGGGTHWTYLGIEPKTCYYVDSFGFAPPEQVVQGMKNTTKKCYYTTIQIQDKNSSSCGWFASYFGWRHSIDKIPFLDVLFEFGYDPKENEQILKKYFGK